MTTSSLQNPTFAYSKALECLDKALDIYRTFLFEEKSYRARSEATYIHLYLSEAVALINHTFTDSPIFSERQAYDFSPESSIYHCPGMTLIPENFFDYARKLLTTGDVPSLRKIVHALISTTRAFVLSGKSDNSGCHKEINNQGLADWYQELSLTWKRIRYFCQNRMVEKAYKDACYLQCELLNIAEEFQMDELNLLGSFTPDDLELLMLRSMQLEQVVLQTLSDHNIKVNSYATLEDFLAER